MQPRQKWTRQRRDLAIGDVVIIKDADNLTRNKWQLARVSKTNRSQDGHVRTVGLVLADPYLDAKGKRVKPSRTLERPVHKLVLLVSPQASSSNPATEEDLEYVPVEEP